MTPQRINEIFQGVQELREWCRTASKEKIIIARQNGKTARAFKYVENIEIICAALQAEENCFACEHFGTKVCNKCLYGKPKQNLFKRCVSDCKNCSKPGALGKELILHIDDNGEREILCHSCHIKKHGGGQ